MTDSQQLALLYEQMLVEDAAARIKYLENKYTVPLYDALVSLEKSIPRSIQHPDCVIASKKTNDYYQIEFEFPTGAGIVSFNQFFNDVVSVVDPTHGKYSEWLVRSFLHEITRAQTKIRNTQSLAYQRAALHECYTHMRSYIVEEDQYKITEPLTAFDKHKGKLPVDERDINKYGLEDLIAKGNLLEQTYQSQPTVKDVKTNEAVKLVDNANGWTVVVPLTKEAARIYGMGTKWCTSARGSSNMFDHYNKKGPLVIFINGDTKFQYWVDINKPFEERTGHGRGPYRSINAQFMTSRDTPADYEDMPEVAWNAFINAPTTNDAIKASQRLVKEVSHSFVLI